MLDKSGDEAGINDSIYENEEEQNEILNGQITKEEVLLAIRKIKNKKSAGPDGIIGELIKYAGSLTVNFLLRFFNALFDRGLYPEIWSESVIIPLYKKGDVNNAENYRGISLCNVTSKLYSTVINNRLQKWVELNNITGEYQAGFKKGYSITDHLFTLMVCVQKQFSSNCKLFVAVIDFKKAFDSFNRHLLWPVLLKK